MALVDKLSDVVLSQKDKETPLVNLKSAEIGFSLFGLLRSEVKSVSVEGLEVSLDLTEKTEKKDEPISGTKAKGHKASGPLAIPLIVKRLDVDEAMIEIKHLKEDGKTGLVEIGPVLATFESGREGSGVRIKLNTKSISKHFAARRPA